MVIIIYTARVLLLLRTTQREIATAANGKMERLKNLNAPAKL